MTRSLIGSLLLQASLPQIMRMSFSKMHVYFGDVSSKKTDQSIEEKKKINSNWRNFQHIRLYFVTIIITSQKNYIKYHHLALKLFLLQVKLSLREFLCKFSKISNKFMKISFKIFENHANF